VGAGLYFYLRPGPPPAPEGKPLQEVLNAVIPAVGRLQAIDMSGQATAVGVAFAVEEGVLVTSCHGISPNAQLNVNLAPRTIPARITLSDPALGLCKLEVAGAGSWPLAVGAAPPKAGDRVYAALITAQGEVAVREVKVTRVAEVIEVAVTLPPAHGGAPLLDVHGRVVAVAVAKTSEGHAASYVPISASWTETARPAPSRAPDSAAAMEKAPEGAALAAEPAPGSPPLRANITPERRDRLEKAFRPPPTVPPEL
jgi:trypsin-like peptidase